MVIPSRRVTCWAAPLDPSSPGWTPSPIRRASCCMPCKPSGSPRPGAGRDRRAFLGRRAAPHAPAARIQGPVRRRAGDLAYVPVAPFTPRGASKPFTFAGHRVEAGEQVMVANGLTHFLPQYFPEPQRFDIDRYSPPHDEHHQGAGIFAPYTLGAHTCLGAGVAELQLMITTAAILRAVRLSFPRRTIS